jgi:deoxycytidine triphosphate deaminase
MRNTKVDMAVLTDKDFKDFQRKGIIRTKYCGAAGATSIDIRIKELYSVHVPKNFDEQMRIVSLPYQEFKKKYLERLPMDNCRCLIGPQGHYIAESLEEFELRSGFWTDVFTRSRWARCGLNVTQVADQLRDVSAGWSGSIPLGISTNGTTVALRKHDVVAQVVIAEGGLQNVQDHELEGLVEKGELVLRKEGRKLRQQEYRFNNGVTLTLDDTILVYNGSVIDPHNDSSRAFDEISIASSGYPMAPHTFYLSSSAEEVRISRKYVGFVKPSDYCVSEAEKKKIHYGPAGMTTYFTHPNAPKIDPYPVFEGKITFECYAFLPVLLKQGMRLTELQLCRLRTPIPSNTKHNSNYKGQKKASPNFKK